jgi:hypothetical protein
MYDDALTLSLDEQPWLKEIVEAAGLPHSLDREGAAIVEGKLLGRPVSPETLRRWPIPYKVVAGYARYAVSDLIAYAKAQYENAPRRLGARGAHAGLPARLPEPNCDDHRTGKRHFSRSRRAR